MVHTATMTQIELIKDQVSEVMDQLPEGDRVKVTDLVRTCGVPYHVVRHAFDTNTIERENRRGPTGSTVTRDDALLIVGAVFVAAVAGIVFLEALKVLKVLPREVFK